MQAPPLGKRVLDPNSFFLYVANHRNTTEGMSVVHNALWARRYAKFAEQAGLNYAAYCELPASRKSSASGCLSDFSCAQTPTIKGCQRSIAALHGT